MYNRRYRNCRNEKYYRYIVAQNDLRKMIPNADDELVINFFTSFGELLIKNLEGFFKNFIIIWDITSEIRKKSETCSTPDEVRTAIVLDMLEFALPQPENL